MTNDAAPPEPATEPEAPPPPDAAPRTQRGTSGAFGRGGDGSGGPAEQLMGLVRQATEAVRSSAEQHLPAVERAAQELSEHAKRAADVAAPHADKLAHEAANFLRDHQDELKAASVRAARIAARLTMPAALRDAVEQELARERPNQGSTPPDARDDNPPMPPPHPRL